MQSLKTKNIHKSQQTTKTRKPPPISKVGLLMFSVEGSTGLACQSKAHMMESHSVKDVQPFLRPFEAFMKTQV